MPFIIFQKVIIAGRNETEGRTVAYLLEEQYGLHKIQFINMNVNDPYEFEGIYNYNIFMLFVFIRSRNKISCPKIVVNQLFPYLKARDQVFRMFI